MTFKEVLINNPEISIVVISFLLTLVMTLITKKFSKQDRMKELKKIQKACQIEIKNHKGNVKKQQEIQKKMMECSMELMKHSFRPMLITFLPLIFIFMKIREIFAPVLSGWLWWYIISAVIASIVLRKLLDVA